MFDLEVIASHLSLSYLVLVTLSLILGILLGAAPGLGSSMGMAMILPFSLTMSPDQAVVFLMAVFIGVSFGNGIPGILVKIPGTPSAALTVIEGYPFTQRGEASRAIGISLTGAVIGQLLGVLAFAVFTIPIASVAAKLLFPEITGTIFIGILAVSAVVSRNLAKGLAAAAIGLLITVIGIDPVNGTPRWDFGSKDLFFGVEIVPAVIGFLAISQLLLTAIYPEQLAFRIPREVRRSLLWRLGLTEWRVILPPILVGSLVGIFIGAVPGAGAAVAVFLAYQVTKSIRNWGKDFGKGSARALASTEAANNSSTAAELIPTLALGIPGGTPMILIMAALTAQGLIPGPRLLENSPQLLNGVVFGLIVAAVLLALIGLLTIFPASLISKVPPLYIVAVSFPLIVAGVYSIRGSMFDVLTAFVTGVLGALMTRYGYPPAATSLTLVLGAMLESNLRRGVVMTGGLTGFFQRPWTVALFLVGLAFCALIVWQRRRERRQQELETVG